MPHGNASKVGGYPGTTGRMLSEQVGGYVGMRRRFLDLQSPRLERRFCLRFVLAVSVSCSGDKSDKEESAGCFRHYGDCALRLQRLLRSASGILTTGGVCQFIYSA